MVVERIVWLVAVALVGAAAVYGGQQLGFASGQQSRAVATQRFLAERGGQGAGASGAGGPVGRFGGQNVAGVVEKVDADRVTLTAVDGSQVTVELAPDGTVRRTVEGSLADLKPGERVVAFGTRSGDVFRATSVQIGGGRAGP